MASHDDKEELRWYVMRDLKRVNARQPAYKQLEEMKMEIFVPMKWSLKIRKGIHVREEVPFIQALEPMLSRNIIKLQITDNHILSKAQSKSKSF